MRNKYTEFDILIKERKNVIQYVIEHYPEIVKHTESAKCYEMYSEQVDDLGLLTPSLIRDKINSGYHKGRKLKQKPTKENYTIYEFDNEMKPLRICQYNQYGCTLVFYFISYENALFAIPSSKREIYSFYPTDIHKIEYRESKIWKYSTIYSCALWQEVYSYKEDDYIECMNYYYVSKLAKSKKSVPLGQIGSPMQAWLAKIHISKNRIFKLSYYSISCKGEELIYDYRR